jgi:hypothetical protein
MASSSTELVDTKTKDYLDTDPELRGQKYVCLSFISPEDAIKRKEVVFFKKFLGAFSGDLETLFTNLKAKLGDEVVELIDGLKQRYDYVFEETALGDEYEFYKEVNSEKLEREYLETNKFQTTIRGIKVRGTYETLLEARNRAEVIKKFDPNHDVYVASVGCWCPWSPYAQDIADVEYSETQLNTLVKKYNENQAEKNEHYRMRRDDMMAKAEKLNEHKKELIAAAEGSTSSLITPLFENDEVDRVNIV